MSEAIVSQPLKHRRRKFTRNKTFRRALPWLVVAGIFLVWQFLVVALRIEPFVLPSPTSIFAAGWQWHTIILQNAWQTLFTTTICFFFAVIIGVVFGVAIGSSSLIYDGFYPALVGFNTIPKVAVVPILIIWFGVGSVP